MATVTLQGQEFHTNGEVPAVGSTVPDITLVDGDPEDRSLREFQAEKEVLNIVTSSTPACAGPPRASSTSAPSSLQ